MLNDKKITQVRKLAFCISFALLLAVGMLFFSSNVIAAAPAVSASYDESAMTVTVTGGGFLPGESYFIRLINQTTESVVVFRTVTANNNGEISGVFHAGQLADGLYNIIAAPTGGGTAAATTYVLPIGGATETEQPTTPVTTPENAQPPVVYSPVEQPPASQNESPTSPNSDPEPVSPTTQTPPPTLPQEPTLPTESPVTANPTGSGNSPVTAATDIDPRDNPQTGEGVSFVAIIAFSVAILCVIALTLVYKGQLRKKQKYSRFVFRKKLLNELLD